MLKPITREIIADLETPVSTYLKLSGNGPTFLLESVTGGENVARYSFIGLQPSTAFVIEPRTELFGSTNKIIMIIREDIINQNYI